MWLSFHGAFSNHDNTSSVIQIQITEWKNRRKKSRNGGKIKGKHLFFWPSHRLLNLWSSVFDCLSCNNSRDAREFIATIGGNRRTHLNDNDHFRARNKNSNHRHSLWTNLKAKRESLYREECNRSSGPFYFSLYRNNSVWHGNEGGMTEIESCALRVLLIDFAWIDKV